MFMYAVGTLPLIHSLHNLAQSTQVWYVYAMDASVCGNLNDIHEWLSQLCSRCPTFGYYPEPFKSFCLLMTDIALKLQIMLFGAFGLL